MALNKKEVNYPQPDAPILSSSPLEALSPNPWYQESFLSKYGYICVGGGMGAATVLVNNYMRRRPFFSGIQLIPVGIAVGATLVYGLKTYREKQWAERDAIFRHYISLHPEDFPSYPKVKIGSLFEDWTPVR